MKLTYEKKDKMTFIGYHTYQMSRILGQGV